MEGDGRKKRGKGEQGKGLPPLYLTSGYGPGLGPRNHMALGPDPPQEGAILWVSGPLQRVANL